MGTSRWIEHDTVKLILALLTVENQLAVELSLCHGMRIGDVLSTKTADVEKGSWTYKEEKTGKRRRVTLSHGMQERLLRIAGRVYVFEHRTDWRRHRTRQAVWKDMQNARKALRLKGTVSPHSARKVYAVEKRRSGVPVEKIRKLLNHENEAVTLLYCMADEYDALNGRRNYTEH